MNKVKASKLYVYLKSFDNDINMFGDEDFEIEGISSYTKYIDGSLTWVKDVSLLDAEQEVSAIVLPTNVKVNAKVSYVSKNPKYIFFKAVDFLMERKAKHEIAPSAIIMESARIEKNVSIGNFSYIGENVTIGENTQIGHNVVIGDNVIIGHDCNIKSGARIGERGFGYSKIGDKYQTINHYGRVVIGNNVDVGNNTCIDQGTIDDTVIGNGTKIDNLCHIAHNVKIGENCCIIANSTIGGSVVIESNSYIALSANILNQQKIGESALVGAAALVTRDIPNHMVCAFSPAKVIRERSQIDKEKY